MGKTAVTLAAIKTLKLKKVLIVAPLIVIQNVWGNEIKKWRRFKNITCIDLHERECQNATIHLINPESLHKLTSFRYDLIVFDESTLFKNPSSKRFKFIKGKIKKIKRRLILTGTPTPKSIHDLWAQIYLLDSGASLYKNIGQFRSRYFDCRIEYVGAYTFPVYTPKENSYKAISKKIAPFTMRIEDTESDEPLINDIVISMNKAQRKPYLTMQKNLFAEINRKKVFAINAAVAYNQCHQLANGAIYDEEKKKYFVLHDKKLDALEVLIEELQGKNVLVGYRFKHDMQRIKKRFDVSLATDKNAIKNWNKGKIQILLAQLQSASKGLNLYEGGIDVVFFSLTDNYEDYIQFIRRLWGSNRNKFVRVHRIITDKTVDVAIVDRLNSRELKEQSFLSYLQNYQMKQSYNRQMQHQLITR
jgi:SNF2 family DNA or RNA helicase